MNEMPKIVRQRLEATQGGAAAEAHPDADLLTGFVERSLGAEERERVLSHLTVCATCREVVALAAPAAEDTQLVVRAIPHKIWWRRPEVLRWGAALATIVVVAAAIMVSGPRKRAIQGPPGQTYGTETVTQTVPQQVPARSEQETSEQKEQAKLGARLEAGQRVARGRTTSELQKSAPTKRDTTTEQDRVQVLGERGVLSRAPSPAEPAPSAPAATVANAPSKDEAVAPALADKKGAIAPSETQDAKSEEARVAGGQHVAANAAAEQVQAESVVMTPKAAAVAPKAAAPGRAKAARQDAFYAVAAPKWSVTSEGRVELINPAGMTSLVRIDDGVRFRTVSVVGNEVWAGGSGGALYHSSDGGQHWAAVRVGTAEEIVRVDFSDALHGAVTTATGAKWTTSDGGKTWTRFQP